MVNNPSIDDGTIFYRTPNHISTVSIEMRAGRYLVERYGIEHVSVSEMHPHRWE